MVSLIIFAAFHSKGLLQLSVMTLELTERLSATPLDQINFGTRGVDVCYVFAFVRVTLNKSTKEGGNKQKLVKRANWSGIFQGGLGVSAD